jgi:hypothetical protein
MIPFEKIKNYSFPKKITLNQDHLLNRYGVMVDDKFIGVSYYKVDPKVKRELLQTFFHPEYRKYFTPSLMIINNPIIPPHIDNDLNIVINYYIQPSDATTYFWRPNAESLTTYQVMNQKDGRLFKQEELEMVGHFKADKNDLWLLDVSQIHSVEMPKEVISNPKEKFTNRIAFCFQSNTLNFTEVVQNLDHIFI